MSKGKYVPPQKAKSKDPRKNEEITASKVRVVSEGQGADVMSLDEALRQAQEAGLDLVEISPDQDPPVCKIINFGKWKFEQQKKKKEQAKHQHVIHIKEIKVRPKIGHNDYEIKLRQALEFLEDGDKVKVTLRFRGREATHPELGMEILERLCKDVEEHALIEAPPKADGKAIIMVIAPKPHVRKPLPKKELATDETSAKVTVPKPEESKDS